ncbi:hypothetical protein GQ55_3G204700 [Panicum hallii var. hallii]|uniref:Uncharacterized protein n=1 Tax=Panicum hallii var. hallii TaxID=1504633 RepID=A0A2T7EBJ0_9POAL|nr:hypothetical protein GQ55_3G204700 [Panicum hallii var. hallii]
MTNVSAKRASTGFRRVLAFAPPRAGPSFLSLAALPSHADSANGTRVSRRWTRTPPRPHSSFSDSSTRGTLAAEQIKKEARWIAISGCFFCGGGGSEAASASAAAVTRRDREALCGGSEAPRAGAPPGIGRRRRRGRAGSVHKWYPGYCEQKGFLNSLLRPPRASGRSRRQAGEERHRFGCRSGGGAGSKQSTIRL